ncbi:MAG TPA: DUF4468 domain-containing protein [Flavobacteriales bacterium]|nr:DUF4468 domain-containing protein [Flavobacteriales bacterium]HIN39494.1 DUF4468 domain-containing protein [Flavobacteriales bacterium]
MQNLIKTSFLAIAMLATINTCCAQKKKDPVVEIPAFIIDEGTKKVVYQGVVEQEGSKDVLFEKALAWATKYYKSPSNVIREKDREKGSLKAKARYYIYYIDPKKGTKTRAHTIEYLLTVQFKEGRYRYLLTDIIYKATSYQGIEQWIDANKKQYSYATASYLVQTDEEINKLISLLKAAIAKQEKVTEDW